MFNIFSFLVVFFPVIAIYQSPVPEIELGTFCFLLLFPFMLKECFKKNIKINIMMPLVLILLYTFISTLVNLMINENLYMNTASILLRTMRFEILLIIVLIVGMNHWFDFKYALGLLRAVTLAAVSYLILQHIVYSLSGFILPGFIEGITKMEWKYTSSLSEFATAYRPTSFFLEPAAFVDYVTIYLTYCLFSGLESRTALIYEAVYITIGIFLSTSGQGVIIIAALWIMWVIKKLVAKEGLLKKAVLLAVVIPVMAGLAYFAYQTDIGNFTVNRVISDTEYNAVEARSGGYFMYDELPAVAQVFGVGYGNYPVDIFFSSFADILFTTGIIGALLVINMYFWAFRKGRLFQKMLCVASFILMSGGGIYTATGLCIYLPFILVDLNKEKIQFEASLAYKET